MKKRLLSVFSIFFLMFSLLSHAQRVMEKLDRGLVAVRTSSSQVFLSWRVLGYDADNVAFNLYRDGVKINSEPIASATNYTDTNSSNSVYAVKTVINNIETGEQDMADVWLNSYLDIALNMPAPMTMPDGSSCTYSPSDCSTGDVDGDGEYEIILKWDPSNAKDNSQGGYTGNVILDVYKLNGTQLCRIDLGRNIRAGAHYTQFMVADFDSDGKAEIACKTAPGTKDGSGNFISKGPAATATHSSDYRNSSGYILSGPEYFTVFSGLTGVELATANYNPARGTVSSWGDSYGNRVDRFLAGVAYLDGIHPSIVMCRGYYTRAVVAAWDFQNGALTSRWVYDSGTSSGVGLYGQGNHNMSVGDVDDDGKDEIIWGSGAVDDDGKLLYRTGLGHGDAMHMSDLDPNRKGLEVWEVHEETGAAYGEEMHDAATGEILWGNYTGSDNGRGCSANVVGGNRGFEMWSSSGTGVFTAAGVNINSSKPSMNFRIYWDGDLQDELLDGTSIKKFGAGTLLSADGCSSNNSTKATPNLSADILGDWREEVIFRTSDNKKLRVFTTTTPTTYKMYTLMHDAIYSNGIAWQNTAYNQPPHAGFYIGDDMDTPPVSAAYNNDKRWRTGLLWDNNVSANWTDSLGAAAKFKNGDGVVFDISAGRNAVVTVVGNVQPKRLIVNSPYDVEFTGNGSITGSFGLKKNGAGVLKLSNSNSFSGNTVIWDGILYNNGILSNSPVDIQSFAKLGGNGVFGNDVTLANLSILSPGNAVGETAKIVFLKSLTEKGKVSYNLDFKTTSGQVTANDTLSIGGDWSLSGSSEIILNVINGPLNAGSYKIAHCAGAINGDLLKLKIVGIPTYLSYGLENNNGDIVLKIKAPASLVWKASVDNKWDNSATANWSLQGQTKTFASNDSVLFNDEAAIKAVVINETVLPSSVLIDNEEIYTFSGSGSIGGVGKLTKNGSSKVIISNTNAYTGKTIINDGTVELSKLTNGGVASPIGAAGNASANIEINGGKLSYTGTSTTIDRGFTLGKNSGTIYVGNTSTVLSTTGKIVGVGKLIKDGSGRLELSVANTYTGGTLIKGGSIKLANDIANASALGTDTITLQGGSIFMFDSNATSNSVVWKLNIPSGSTGTLNVDGNSLLNGSIIGGGTLNYFTGYTENVLLSDVSSFTGTINVTTDADGGNFLLYSAKGYERAKINLYNKVTMIYRVTSNITIPVGDLTGFSGAILGAGGTGPCTVTWEVGARNLNSSFNGVIADNQYTSSGAKAAISKVGTGTWTLTNDNTFTGGVNINNGVLMVNNTAGSGLGTGDVNVNSQSALAGNGAIAGRLFVKNQAMLTPGNGVGAFTVNNNVDFEAGAVLEIEVDKTTSRNDILNCTGTVTMGGSLVLTPVSTTVFEAGDVFKIINGTVIGLPTDISPVSPGDGLEWDLSEFISGGLIKVRTITGINELELKSKAFPVPCKDFLNIHLDESIAILKISIVDMYGKIVYTNSFENQTTMKLNVSSLPKGVYLLKLHSANKSFTQRINKE